MGLKLCLHQICSFHSDHLHSDLLFFFLNVHTMIIIHPHPPLSPTRILATLGTWLTRAVHLKSFIFFPNKFNFVSGIPCSYKAQERCKVHACVLCHTHACAGLDTFSIHLAHTSKYYKPGRQLENDRKYDYINCSMWLL